MKEEVCKECQNTNGEHKPGCSRVHRKGEFMSIEDRAKEFVASYGDGMPDEMDLLADVATKFAQAENTRKDEVIRELVEAGMETITAWANDDTVGRIDDACSSLKAAIERAKRS